RYNGYIKDVLMYYNKHITLKDGTVITIHQDSVLHHIDTTLIDTITFSPVIKPMAFVHQNFTFSRNIEQQSIAQNNIIANLIVHSGKNEVIVQNNVVASDSIAAPITYYRDRAYSSIINGVKAATTMHIDNIDLQSQPPPTVRTDSIPPPKKKSDFLFQSEFDDKPDDTKKDVEKKEVNPPQAEVLTPDESANKIIIPKNDTQNNLQSKHHQFRTSRIIPYRLKFRTDFLTSRLDNSMLFGGLDSYAGGKQGVNYPPMGLLLKANYKDILEDYEIETGARFPVSFNGSEYFVIFNNKKSRWDRSYALYRSQYKHGDANVRDKVTTTLAYGEMKYPFDIFSAIKFGATLRNDRTAPLILDGQSLERNITNTQRVGLKVAYIYDNTLDIVPNIKNGTRCKIEFEALKRFELKTVDKFSLSFNNGWMGVLTLDARHYKRIAKYSVLAFRLAGATSFGSENILYYMGGVDNWLFPKYNQSIPVPEGNYAFRTLASNMRGFAQNIRNGTSYFVTNTELRVPVFTYFTQKRIKSSLIRNFQLVGFFDLGTAWHGLTPFSPSNPLNAVEISNSQVTVKVNYFRDPLVASYGYGLRTTIFGYWVRLDYGKGIETRVVQPAVWHFSIGYDF
ncbi:MAG: hypothetical protein KA010_04515, partial [Saprospiraceae bacterium]|nr:hypothetical protein [Saprospiraceae bacterium]